MKNFTTEIYNEKAKNGARYYIRATIGGVPIQDELQNFDYNANCNPDRVFSIGNVGSAMAEFEIYQPSQNLTNKEILIEQGIKLNGVIEYVKLGYFNVLKPTNNRGIYKYQCVDRMISKMETPYFSELTFPTTDIVMLKEICTQVGISLDNENSLISHAITNNLQGYTKREIIAYLSQLQGKNAIINSEGNLELIWYTPTNYVVDDDKIYMDRADEINSETDYVIEYIKCNVTTSEGIIEIQSGDGLNGVTISNPFMTQAILDEVFASIGGFSFRPVEFDFYGDFRLEVGDVITLSTYGQTYNVPIMQLTQKSDGGVITSVTSIAETETENNINLKSPNTKEMDRYYADLIIINRAMVSKLDADSAIIKDLTAKTTKTDTLIFGSAGGNVIQTSFSNSVIAQLGDAQIKSAMIQDVSASKITAGTIYTDDVTIQSKNGQMILSDNTIQISDGTRARVQIGKDASNDYSINVWDKSGNLMFSQGGITDKAIKSAIIRNDMVSENANIHAGKLDISSLFTEINNSSETIKANKIYLDEQKQTLEVSFKSMTTTVDGLKQTQTSQGTQLEALNGKIASKVWQQDITTAIDDINVGGRNLLINTKEFSKTTTQNQTSIALNIGKFSEYYMATRTSGKQITISFDWETTAESGAFRLSFDNTPWATIFPSSAVAISPTNKGGKFKYVATLTDEAVNDSALYTAIRLVISNVDGTTTVRNVKCEYGNKATDWTPAPEEAETVVTTLTTKYSTLEQDISGFKTTVSETYSTKTETKTVETIATQTANKFNWIVKNGTSATNFTLTDRMAKLTAEIISLNGNVKVNGDMLVDGAVTADKIAIGDFTNLAVINPDAYNPDNYTVVQDNDGVNWFEFGSDTTLGYYKINLNVLPSSTIFKKGDDYLFRGLLKASINTSVRICVRVVYVDDTYTNLASVYYDNVTTESKEIKIPFTINSVPESAKTISRYIIFLETRNTQLGIIYARDLSVHQMTNNVLIADGTITADKIDVADLFAQDIVAKGSIISPLLKSSDYKYDGATTTGAEYSTTGMIVDLKNKLIRTPKFCIRADGTACLENGIFSGKVTAKSGEISGNLAFGASGSITHTNGDYTVTLRSVRSNAAYGVFYITDNSGDSPTYPFMVSGDGSLLATKATITGNITANEGSIGPITIQKNQGLYYSPAETSGFGLWATTAHDNIAFHAGANNTNIGGAPFRVYHNGKVVAKNIDVQGGSIGNWSVENGILTGIGSGTKMALYPNGMSYNVSSTTTDIFFLVVYNAGGAKPVGGLTNSGWKTIYGG